MIVKASLATTAPIPTQHKATAGSTFVSNDRKCIFPAPPRQGLARYSTQDINTIGTRRRQSNCPQMTPLGARKNPRVSSLHHSNLIIVYQIVTWRIRNPGGGAAGAAPAPSGAACGD